MSFLGDAALTAIPVIGSAVSGAVNAHAQKEAYQHRFQWEVADLKKAGLNPSLAYGHSPSAPNVATMPDLGSSAAQGYNAMKQGKQTAAQARLVASQAAVNEATAADQIAGAKLKNLQVAAQTSNTQSGTALNLANIPLTNAKVGETLANTRNLGATTDATRQNITESKERIQLIRAQTGTTQAQARQIQTTIQQMQQDMRWQRATWDVKISLLQKELQQAGVNVQNSRLEKLGRELGLNEQRAESRFYGDFGESGATGARELVRTILQYLK